MDVDETSKDDSSSDTSDDEVVDEELQRKIDDLNLQIKENNYSYDSHIQLITLLRGAADLANLREARERMAKYFPLTAQLWTEWLSDEMKIATSPEEQKDVVDLFERAIKDYISVELWKQYIEFTVGIQAEADETNVEDIRKLFERALTAAGLHVSEGTSLWDAYVAFEIGALETIETTDATIIDTQKKRVANLFRRQLSCPLKGMEDTFDTFKMWLDDNSASSIVDMNLIENTYKASLEKLRKIEKFEEALVNNPADFREYLDYEKFKDGSPARVQCLFERILCDQCLDPSVWLEYIEYVESKLENKEGALEISHRSLRNCPWSCLLAKTRMQLLEKYECPHAEVTAVVEQAISSGLQQVTDFRDIWMAFLEYMRRRYDNSDSSQEEKLLEELLAAFSKAVEFVNKVDNSDPECLIAQFWARIEAKCAKNMASSRSIWSDILADRSRQTAVMWLEYINLEMAYGDSKHLRKLFPRALSQVTDWPESIFSVWLNFERDEGTLDSYLHCVSTCEQKMKQFKELREKEAQATKVFSRPQREDRRKPKRAGLGFNAEKKEIDEESTMEVVEQSSIRRKRPAENSSLAESSPPKKTRTDDIVSNLLNNTRTKDHGVTVKHDSSKDDRTIFLSNLDYTTDDKILRNIFEPDGQITDIRIVKDFKGRSKGYCYVEFLKEASVAEALKRDRHPIDGRPMYVSKCDPDKETRGTAFRYNTSLEKNKLFVKGLPFTTTEADLRSLFGKFGDLRDVRLVTLRNGHSKGIAYIDYEDEVSAKQAILKTDGTQIGDKTIFVALSNPSFRPKPDPNAAPKVASLGGGPKVFGSRGRGRTQLSFLPRTLRLNPAPAAPGIEDLAISSPQSKEELK